MTQSLEVKMADKFNRKDLLLLFLLSPGPTKEEAEPITGRTRLMKLLYLLQQETPTVKLLELKNPYDFKPYHYGPFAKDVYDDLEFLENVGLIEVLQKGYASPVEQNEVDKLIDDAVIGEDEDTGILFNEESYKLTARGLNFTKGKLAPTVPDQVLKEIQQLKSKFAKVPLSSVLRYVYVTHPDSAKNSKLKALMSSG